MARTIIFAPGSQAPALAASLNAILANNPAEASLAILAFRANRDAVMVATKGWAIQGWRAPPGTSVFFLDGFDPHPAIRHQAMARVDLMHYPPLLDPKPSDAWAYFLETLARELRLYQVLDWLSAKLKRWGF